MQTLIVEIDSESRAKELTSMLNSMSFVKKVSAVKKPATIIKALQEHEAVKASNVKKKNKAIAKYL